MWRYVNRIKIKRKYELIMKRKLRNKLYVKKIFFLIKLKLFLIKDYLFVNDYMFYWEYLYVRFMFEEEDEVFGFYGIYVGVGCELLCGC